METDWPVVAYGDDGRQAMRQTHLNRGRAAVEMLRMQDIDIRCLAQATDQVALEQAERVITRAESATRVAAR